MTGGFEVGFRIGLWACYRISKVHQRPQIYVLRCTVNSCECNHSQTKQKYERQSVLDSGAEPQTSEWNQSKLFYTMGQTYEISVLMTLC